MSRSSGGGAGRRWLRLSVAVVGVVAVTSFAAAAADAKDPGGPSAAAAATITSAGPLTNIFLSDVLNCQVDHSGDADHEFFGGVPGACATEIATGGHIYGPDSIPAGNDPGGYTPVSQTAVTGTGTGADPFQVITVVDVGVAADASHPIANLRITETDTYVVGTESYRTDVQVKNTASIALGVSAQAATTFVLYRGGDCFLQSSDNGFGDFFTTGPNAGQVGCHASDDGGVTPGLRIERWIPITAGSAAMEAGYADVWSAMSSMNPFPNTCLCSSYIDNGAGLSWSGSLNPGETATYSHLTVFSPTGVSGPFLEKTAAAASVPAGGNDSYTVTLHNVGGTALTVNSITDHLPDAFVYVPGSSTGATTTNPTVSAHDLTWAGSFTVAAGADLTLTFSVTVGTTAGTFTNSVDADAVRTVVTGTGATAPVTVTAVPVVVIAPTFAG
jgi:uncharacterized repeat protein (TIGR01451 family)